MSAEPKSRSRRSPQALALVVTLLGAALSGCGVESTPIDSRQTVYTADNPPPILRAPNLDRGDFLSDEPWYVVGSGAVTQGIAQDVLGGNYRLSFHAGSLTVPQLAATIQERNPGLIDFELGPHGAEFATPVTLTISYAGTNADPASPNFEPGVLEFYYLNPTSSIWERIPGVDDTAARTYTISLAHFSRYALAKAPGNPGGPPPGTGDW